MLRAARRSIAGKGKPVKHWHSSMRAVVLAALLAGLSGPDASIALAEEAPPPPPAPPAAQPAEFSLPSAERPLVITITPEFSKALKKLKDETLPPPDVWPPQEIADAKARCEAILKRIHAVAVPETPIKSGACGAPAPLQLLSVGKSPEVSLSPPATVTCDMAEALSQWVENDLQPLARKHLGASLIKIEVMSSYSCRNAYGRKSSKLSEHGTANALDIRGFITASANTALVLQDWGKTQREILAEIEAAKAAQAKAAALKAAAEKAGATAGGDPKAPPPASAPSEGASAETLAKSTIIEGIPAITVSIPGAKAQATIAPGIGYSEPSHLGAPTAPTDGRPDKRRFLHAAHAAACRIFGTALGPEANAAHRNHLHVDMAQRRSGIKICD